jgi:phosphate transport system permease protein
MTLLLDDPTEDAPAEGVQEQDAPRSVDPGLGRVDKTFRFTVRGIGMFVLVMTVAIGGFLGWQATHTYHDYGLKFFYGTTFDPSRNLFQIAPILLGTVEVALVALAVGFPIALMTALFITEYAPSRLKSPLIALVDMMAAVPSVIVGVWAVKWLQDRAIFTTRWISQNLGWIPIFHVDGDIDAASNTWQINFIGSVAIAGLVVGLMIVPLACSVMRGVFDLAPLSEREAAYALGSTKWGMIRTVVIPFGRGGIIGGTMLALGRALGETVAVLLIITNDDTPKIQVLSGGTDTISAMIASQFGNAHQGQLAAYLTAGFVLFVMTIAVNTVAAIFVNRSRSGAGVDV